MLLVLMIETIGFNTSYRSILLPLSYNCVGSVIELTPVFQMNNLEHAV